MEKTVNKKRLDNLEEAEAAIFSALSTYFDLLEQKTVSRSGRWAEKQEAFERAVIEVGECEERLSAIKSRQAAMEREINLCRLHGDAMAEAELVDEFADLKAERANLETRIKAARAITTNPTYRRYGDSEDPGIATVRETVRVDPLRGVDSFKRRVIASVDAGRERVRGAIL